MQQPTNTTTKVFTTATQHERTQPQLYISQRTGSHGKYRRKYAPSQRLRAHNEFLPGRQRLGTLKSTTAQPHRWLRELWSPILPRERLYSLPLPRHHLNLPQHPHEHQHGSRLPPQPAIHSRPRIRTIQLLLHRPKHLPHIWPRRHPPTHPPSP